MSRPRLAVRAVIVENGRLLLVNAYPGGISDLWCAPGGGVDAGASLTDNLIREVHEETGCAISVGALCLINEFHDPDRGFHQVDLFFRARLTAPPPAGPWTDPAGVVTEQRFVPRAALPDLRLKPDRLPEVAFGSAALVTLSGLERIAPP
ncbi:MAG: NUDIX hydrolase [Pseudomonadota bacterium]